MADAFSVLFLVAALVLCIAAVAKLRAPVTAARVLADLGLASGTRAVRAFAAGELALGSVSLLAPSRSVASAVCMLYVSFALLSAALARRALTCGCFGVEAAPASATQSALSVFWALVSAGAIAWPGHGLGLVLSQAPGVGAALIVGLAAAAYASVLAYIELPTALSAWERS